MRHSIRQKDPAYGVRILRLRPGESTLHCLKAEDALEGLKEVMRRNGLKCRKKDFDTRCVMPGRSILTFHPSGKRFLIYYRGNRDYEILRVNDEGLVRG